MLLHAEYFARYGEHLSAPDEPTPYAAWLRTEAEFMVMYPGLRKFRTYNAFREAHRRFRDGRRIRQIKLHIV